MELNIENAINILALEVKFWHLGFIKLTPEKLEVHFQIMTWKTEQLIKLTFEIPD